MGVSREAEGLRWLLATAGLFASAIAAAGGSGPESPRATVAQPAVAGSARPALRQALYGRVRDETGKPVVGALVVPRSLQPSGPAIPELAILSDASGLYAWPLQPGAYEVVVSAEGHETARGRVSVTKGSVATLDVVLKRRH